MGAIIKSQTRHTPPSESIYKKSDDIPNMWVTPDGQMYLQPGDEEVLLRIFVSAHCGLEGHRVCTRNYEVIKAKLHLPTLDADVKVFVQSCLVCLLS